MSHPTQGRIQPNVTADGYNPTDHNGVNVNTNTVIHTKKDKDASAVETKLTINWEGLTEEEVRAIAQQALIVKLQGALRRDEAGIPSELTINAVDYKVGVRTAKAKVNVFDLVKAMSAEDRAAFIAKLQES